MENIKKAEAKKNIQKLVKKYEDIKRAGKIKGYNEAQTRNEFIEPLFQFLGWDMRNIDIQSEVTTEEVVSKGRVDLAFRINNIPMMFLEAKALKVDLDEWKWAEQAINYSWNRSVTWSILTDFEGIKVFNAEIPPKDLSQNLFFELKWNQYIDNFNQLWLLSKDSFESGLLTEEAEKWGKLRKRKQVGEKLFEDLTKWRTSLTKSFNRLNKLSTEDLDEGVQRLLDRLIFIRTAEDRNIEANILLSMIRSWESIHNKQLYPMLIKVFRDFDEGYNSKLFAEHYSEKWKLDDVVLKDIINELYTSDDGYRYDFSLISADVLGGIYEQYLGHVLQQAKIRTNLKEQHKKRKFQGIYYTPKYIVDFIIRETLGQVLKERKLKDIHNIKVLDPACGSGSFLTAAYDEIVNHYERQKQQISLFTKFDVLKENLYGVDLDEQATEIAQLNLLLKVLIKRSKLPMLQSHIKIGNSLISGKDELLQEYFGDNLLKTKPFNWNIEFKNVMESGGFDVIVGNPPYIRVQSLAKDQVDYFNANYKSAVGNYDIYVLFIEKAISLLRDGGRFGMILPNKFIETKYGEGIRKLLSTNKIVSKIVNFGDYQIFPEVTTYTCLLFLEKKRKNSFQYVDAGYYLSKTKERFISEKKAESFSIKTKSISQTPWILVNPQKLNILSRMDQVGIHLKDVTERIFQGLKTGADDVYIVDEISKSSKFSLIKSRALNDNFTLESAGLYPLIKGTEMRKFRTLNTNRRIIFPYSKEGKLLKRDELEKKFPRIFNYLTECAELLGKREKGKFKGENFYQYSRNQAISVIRSTKIITPDLAPSARFNLDVNGKYFFTGGAAGGYGIVLTDKINPYFLIGLLNSKAVDWYLKMTSSKFRGHFYSYESRFIQNLPIAVSAPQLSIANTVMRLMDFYNNLNDLHEKTDRFLNLKEQINSLEEKINREVYKFYKLNQDEIKIIESNTEFK